MDPSMWRSRAVIIHRDDNGYGLTVFGDNPVSVQTIKQGGAAELAGIREGDIIVKVNGTLVEHMTHTEVVNLIKSAGPYVTLTVRPPECNVINMPGVGFLGGNGGRSHNHLPLNERVTAPLPVNQDVQMQMQGSKLRTLQQMRDKAAKDVEKLWAKYKSSQDPRDLDNYEKAQQGLKTIESQIKSTRNPSNPQLHSPVPYNQISQVHQSVPFQPYPSSGYPQQQSHPSVGMPPMRNRNPLSVPGGATPPTYQNVGNPMPWMDNDIPPPLPPRLHPHQSPSYPSPEYSLGPTMSGYPSPPPSATSAAAITTSFHNHNSTTLGLGRKNSQTNPSPSTNADITNKSNLTSSSSTGPSHQQLQTHHRTKSSPDPVSMQKALNAEGSRRSDSFNDLSKNSNSRSRASGAWDSVDSNYLSPPGSPPPPYGRYAANNNCSDHENNIVGSDSHMNNVLRTNLSTEKLGCGPIRPGQFSGVDIITMEEDDGLFSNDNVTLPSISGFHGPYSSLSRLLEYNAHLAVFINYVIDNRRDPNSLLFYLITGFDIEEGSLKEIKRWGYEIHSTFTAPGAPLIVPNVDESIAAEIDDALLHEIDKEEIMRRVFRKARNKAKEEVNKQLEDFCTKRTAGLGSMYGPPDNQLEESLQNKAKELQIVETYLVPRVEQFNIEVEKNSDNRTFAIMVAVASVILKLFGLRNHPNLNLIVEKHGMFVSKEKSMKSRFMSKNKKVTHNGHHFVPVSYTSYTECNICSKLLWGIGPQGQQCVDCNLNVHRSQDSYRSHNCMNEIHDTCLGTSQKKDRANDKLRRLRDRIRPENTKKRASNSIRRLPDDNSWGSFGESDTGERQVTSSGSSSNNQKGDRRPDTLSEERLTSDGYTFEDEDVGRVQEEPKKPSSAVGRSESCKERVHRKQTRERRKHSDPNLTSKSSDVDLDNQRQLSDANNSGSSSNSSLSARYLTSLESPSTSLELVAPSNNSSSSLPGRNSETPETTVGHSGALPDSFKPSPGWDGDSDIEIEQDPPDWTKNVPEENLSRLDRLEKKRQEVLNELFHTERSHVRNLKVVDELFYRPIRHQLLLPLELIQMLFANLEEMLEIHGRFNSSLKKLRKESSLVGEIGQVLLEMFDGEDGENFKRAAATFCAKQQIGLEILRERRRKDLKFHAFLQEAESHPVCRRLGIKDMIPMAMQRLTKYPLLFENLCNCTAADSDEYKNIQRAVDLSKEILCHVNSAKKEAEDLERLIEIQRKLDKSAFDKDRDAEIKNLDFTKHRLIYEGPLYWRMTKSRQKSEQIEVQAVLLHDMIVILLKQDDRFVLKAHNMGIAKSAGNPAKPIIKLSNLHHRPVATDKRAFFVISTTTSNMYELVCSTPEERNMWFHHITKAADDYKNRQESRRSELHPASNIPPSINAEPEEKSKDSVEGSGTEGLTNTGDSVAEQLNESPGRHLHDHNHPGSPKIIQKEASPAPDSTSSEPPTALSPDKSGDGKLMVGSKVGRSVSASPSAPRRIKQGEFLKVTESSPLVEPSEVVVVTRDVQFAQSVLSPYEELKRADSAVQKALEEKMRLASKLFNIPVENQLSSGSTGSADVTSEPVPKDAKEMIVTCMKNVDKLIGIVGSQKVTKENMEIQKEQQQVHSKLSALLTQIMSEYERKEEELELRRQELHRIREQNHGYQERLQLKTSNAKQVSSPTSGGLSSPTLSPRHSRPNSFLSSSSDPQPEEEQEVVTKTPLKPQLSDPVATSSSNLTNSSTTTKDNTRQLHDSSIPAERLMSQLSTSDLAQDEFADAAAGVGLTSTDDLSSGVETNRESTETEVVMSTTDSSSNSSSETIIVDTSMNEMHEIEKENNGKDVPELGSIHAGEDIVNGHSSLGDTAMSSGDENCNKDVPSSNAALVDSSSTKNTGNIVVTPEDLEVNKQSNNGNENS